MMNPSKPDYQVNNFRALSWTEGLLGPANKGGEVIKSYNHAFVLKMSLLVSNENLTGASDMGQAQQDGGPSKDVPSVLQTLQRVAGAFHPIWQYLRLQHKRSIS